MIGTHCGTAPRLNSITLLVIVIIGVGRRDRVAAGKGVPASGRTGILPFRLQGEKVVMHGAIRNPVAIIYCIFPTDSSDRQILFPIWNRRSIKDREFMDRNMMASEREWMPRPLGVISELRGIILPITPNSPQFPRKH
jgi:hypothetical protein